MLKHQPDSPHFNSNPRLILASSSVYRHELLARLQIPFESRVPDIDETARHGEIPEATALRLAQQKAEAIAKQLTSSAADFAENALIIGSDQVATLNGIHIGKPGDHASALKQLQLMRGKEVVFHTALCLLDTRSGAQPAVQLRNVQTVVRFRDLPDAELDAYLRIEQPYDCAGSAKNEALGISILASIQSDDPTALTGLPLIALTDMLRKAGVQFYR
ncbi:septum formation protein Maf [Undibacterium sp. FT147W]|uniref:7-methyl-GTP pyrophosphatase n=1 Tax=Undibacterium rivi TaxID=2828729 RepID=A0ABS5H036_9BURK|nr:Maf family nucleotide pyrophosphatase [Undibacterium rivi]MBR7792068.1 septum formation protein Maf [Undibacterium rivi]